jgi:RPA family protein
MAAYDRLCAVITSIGDIIEAEYKEMPGWEPNYIMLHKRIKASRLNVIGTVIDIHLSNPLSMTIDDGTGQIEVRSFDEVPKTPSVGETIIVVGKPRKYNERLYISTELIRIMDDTSWVAHRKRQITLLKKYYSNLPVIEEAEPAEVKEALAEEYPAREEESLDVKKELTDSERIYNMITEFDGGDGAQISIILEKCEKDGIRNAEKAIQLMLEMGDIFEIKSGRVKIL